MTQSRRLGSRKAVVRLAELDPQLRRPPKGGGFPNPSAHSQLQTPGRVLQALIGHTSVHSVLPLRTIEYQTFPSPVPSRSWNLSMAGRRSHGFSVIRVRSDALLAQPELFNAACCRCRKRVRESDISWDPKMRHVFFRMGYY